MKKAREPFGLVTFCDDIRQEAWGKTSLIGIYGNEMLVYGTFPVTVAKLGIVAHYNIDAHDPNPQNAEIRIVFPGESEEEPGFLSELPVVEMFKKLAEQEGEEDGVVRITASVLLSPLTLKEPGRIKVLIVRGAQKLRLGSLAVKEALQSEGPPTVVDGGTF